MRTDWDSYFMKIAAAVSERSTCDRAFVAVYWCWKSAS